MKYREGKVEYFGKKGMYLLGFMVVSHYPGNESGYQGGFQYKFVDVVADEYSLQDNIQVVSILHFVLLHAKENHPLVNIMFMHSDILTWFSSQEHVPYIYHKNKEWTVALSIMILLWIFTES